MADFLRSIVEDLATHLEGELGASISAVYREWPDANQEMTFPSVSITSGKPRFTRCAPYLLTTGAVASHQATTTYVIGQYDLDMQLDVWTRYNIQRSQLYELVNQALNPVDDIGLVLTLSDYYSQIASFLQVDVDFLGDSQAATVNEWRVMMMLKATCNAVGSRTDYIITQDPELVFTTPDNIDEE